MNGNQLEAVFDDYLGSEGGRMRLDQEDSDTAPLLRQMQQHFRKRCSEYELEETPRKKIVSYVDYVDNHDFNCVAFVARDQGFIGIYRGFVPRLFELFTRGLRAPDALTGTRTSIDLRCSEEQHNVLPLHLAMLAMEFAVDHEAGHLRNGHVDWLLHTEGIHGLFEHNKLVTKIAFAWIIRLSKWMLTVTLLGAICGFLRTDMVRCLSHQDEFKMNPYYHSFRQCFAAFFFAAYILFRSFEELSWNVDDLVRRDHPPAPMRQQMLLGLFQGFVNYNKDYLRANAYDVPEDPGRILVETFVEAERAYAEAIGRGVDRQWLLYIENPKNAQHYEKVRSNWKALRSQLEPFARGEHLPPP